MEEQNIGIFRCLFAPDEVYLEVKVSMFVLTILFHLYCSMSKIKVLDSSGPLGLPSLLGGALETAISALSFSPDGEVHSIPYFHLPKFKFILYSILLACFL